MLSSSKEHRMSKGIDQGFTFWPVGTGDSTTVFVRSDVIVQVDLRHLAAAGEEDDPHCPIVDELIKMLPEIGGERYLSVFVLTHPDEDHCQGFAELLKRVTIGEIWFTPRIFREYQKDLCEDAKAFKKEAMRRVRKTIDDGRDVSSGDRVRIIGYDERLEDDEYEGFPGDRLTVPGKAVCELDGVDQQDRFRAFVHAPFKDDAFGDRNNASLGLQVTLLRGSALGKALLLGDLAYPTISRIFERSDDDDLEWNVLLAPHHCSKSVMYWQAEDEEEESLKQDVMNGFSDCKSSTTMRHSPPKTNRYSPSVLPV
jgi:beta-lactamase superfamily II metal-dependent hydrolase